MWNLCREPDPHENIVVALVPIHLLFSVLQCSDIYVHMEINHIHLQAAGDDVGTVRKEPVFEFRGGNFDPVGVSQLHSLQAHLIVLNHDQKPAEEPKWRR